MLPTPGGEDLYAIKEIGGDITNKPCGIGSVGFPRPLLPVAIGAVSLQSKRHTVSACATELPLSPHCNLCHIPSGQSRSFPRQPRFPPSLFCSRGFNRRSLRLPLALGLRALFRYPPQPLKAGYTAGSLCTAMQVFMTQSRHASTKDGSSSAMPLTAAHNSYFQHRPPTGRQQPAPETSSICPLTDF